MIGANVNKAAPGYVVLPHYCFAALSFAALSILLFFSLNTFTGHYFNPKTLSIVHLASVGWISMIIMGALYQLLPVITGATIYSHKLAVVGFVLFAIGSALIAYSFWNFLIGFHLQTAAILIFSGASFFLINALLTFKNASDKSIEHDFILTSIIWFWLTVALGTLLAFNLTLSFLPQEHLHYLKIHAHIGFAGWFMLLIIGVSSKLIPMFIITESYSKNQLKWTFFLIHIGLIGFIVDFELFNGMDRLFIYFFIAVLGIINYIFFVIKLYNKRKRKEIDINMKNTFMAILLIGIPLLTGIFINTPGLLNENYTNRIVYLFGSGFLLGFISTLILGQTYKTLPFIVWLNKYKSLVGKEKTPLPKDLYNENLLKIQFIGFLLGYFLLSGGIAFQNMYLLYSASILIFIAALLYNFSVFSLVFHKPIIK